MVLQNLFRCIVLTAVSDAIALNRCAGTPGLVGNKIVNRYSTTCGVDDLADERTPKTWTALLGSAPVSRCVRERGLVTVPVNNLLYKTVYHDVSPPVRKHQCAVRVAWVIVCPGSVQVVAAEDGIDDVV